jgi:hypothetical protein
MNMNEDIAYSLVNLLPTRVRQYGLSTLDRAVEELDTYLLKNDLEMDENVRNSIKLAVIINFIEELFVDSYYSYTGALALLKEQNVGAIKFGTNTYAKGDPLDWEWRRFVEAFRGLQTELRQYHIPSGKTIRELIEDTRRLEDNFRRR